MHTYNLLVVHTPNLVKVASILWPQLHPQQIVDRHSSVKNAKVEVLSTRSNVTRPKFHAHAHLPLVGSPQAQTDQSGINTLVKRVPTRIPRSRSHFQGQRAQDQFIAHAYLHPAGSRHPILAWVASISWPQRCLQKFGDGQMEGQSDATYTFMHGPDERRHIDCSFCTEFKSGGKNQGSADVGRDHYIIQPDTHHLERWVQKHILHGLIEDLFLVIIY